MDSLEREKRLLDDLDSCPNEERALALLTNYREEIERGDHVVFLSHEQAEEFHSGRALHFWMQIQTLTATCDSLREDLKDRKSEYEACHAAYQDACNSIATLMNERDEAREQVASFGVLAYERGDEIAHLRAKMADDAAEVSRIGSARDLVGVFTPTKDVEFVAFRKIPRLSREVIVTEKIDGTNAVIYIGEDGTFLAGSRTRWIAPDKDNFGFAAWAQEHREELMGLGPGYHFGEWWGRGIQRRYGLDHKRFSLFNVSRWNEETPPPACCHVVPVLWRGEFDTQEIALKLVDLSLLGSVAAPGFMDPEGVVIFHSASGTMFKKTIKGDEKPKGSTE